MKITPLKQHLLDQFGLDPLYRSVILAPTVDEIEKAGRILSSIRGPNALRLLETAYRDYNNNTNRGG